PLDGIEVKRRVGNIMRQPVGDRHRGGASPLPWDAACDSHLAHSCRPACSRIRGSSTASARSDMKTPMTVRNAMNIKNEPARYMYWLRKASSSIVPVVGSDITIETTAAPDMTCGTSQPTYEHNWVSAMRSGYL